jgi:branched-chain amino acid transport system permease protein
MLYREAGQFKTSYVADQAIFPILQDRIFIGLILAVAFLGIPALAISAGAEAYWLGTIMLPLLTYALAAIGLNILTGYAGQVSLGTGGFMAVGAFAAYKLATAFPGLNVVLVFPLAGLITAAVGIIFGFRASVSKAFISRWRRSLRSFS